MELNLFTVLKRNPIEEKDLIFAIEFIIVKVIFNFGSFLLIYVQIFQRFLIFFTNFYKLIEKDQYELKMISAKIGNIMSKFITFPSLIRKDLPEFIFLLCDLDLHHQNQVFILLNVDFHQSRQRGLF